MIEPAGIIAIRPTTGRNRRKHNRKRASACRFRFHRPAGIVLITLSMSSSELFFKVLIASVRSSRGNMSPLHGLYLYIISIFRVF